MKKIVCICAIFVFIIACSKKNIEDTVSKLTSDLENNDIDAEVYLENNFGIMYVNSPDGLRVRNIPNLSGERIGLLSHLTEVKISKEDKNLIFIDNIEGKWVYIIADDIEGWVFNGYLTPYKDSDIQTINNQKIQKSDFYGTWIHSEVEYIDKTFVKTFIETYTISELLIVTIQESYNEAGMNEFYEENHLKIIDWSEIDNFDSATMEMFPNGYSIITKWLEVNDWSIFISKDKQKFTIPSINAGRGEFVEFIKQ